MLLHHAARASRDCAGMANARAPDAPAACQSGTLMGRYVEARCVDMFREAAGTLFAELDLLDRREVLDVDAGREVRLVPVDLR